MLNYGTRVHDKSCTTRLEDQGMVYRQLMAAAIWCGLLVGASLGQERLKTHLGIDVSDVRHHEIFGGTWSANDEILSATGSPAKMLLRDVRHDDFELTVELRTRSNSQAGVIFRVAKPTAATDGFNGYYVGLHAGENQLLWGAMDGRWHEIARRPAKVEADVWHKLRLIVRANHVQAWIDETPVAEGSFPKFDGVDDRFSSGRIGLRMLGKGAEFRKLAVRDLPSETNTDVAKTYTNPVQASCADPCVLLHDGNYYAYCTYSRDFPNMPRGIRLYTSKNLKDWTDKGFVIRKEQSWGESRFWAPDIIERDGEFYLYYAADTRICVAKSKSPSGPFTQIGRLPMEPDSIRIDAHVFKDDDGRYYFYYVHFNRGNEIWGGELNDDMVSVKRDSLQRMIKPDQAWERHQAPIAEGPAMLKHDGTYYLTYSGSHFEHPNYAVGYATSDSPLGPWEKHEFNPIMKSTAYAHGTAHHCFTTSPDGKETFIVYHRHFSLNETEPRAMSIDRVRFVPQEDGPATLEVWGPTSSPQPLPSGAPASVFDNAAANHNPMRNTSGFQEQNSGRPLRQQIGVATFARTGLVRPTSGFFFRSAF